MIRTDDYKAWWEALPQETRKYTRQAAKKGIEIRSAVLDNDLAQASRQSTMRHRFVKVGNSGITERILRRLSGRTVPTSTAAKFLGAYYSGQLVGFMKFVYVGDAARIMQILCLNAHQDKRPMTALIAKAAEICHQKGLKYLIYGKFSYGRKTDDGISEFKQRLGFVQKDIPCYHVALCLRGHIALKLGLHKSWRDALPPKLIDYLIGIRTWWLQRSRRRNIPPIHKEGIGAGGGN